MSGEDQDKVINIRPQQTDDKVVYESTTLPPWKRDYRGFSGTMGNREDSGKQAIDVISAGLDLDEKFIVAHVVGKLSKERFRQQ